METILSKSNKYVVLIFVKYIELGTERILKVTYDVVIMYKIPV